MLQLKRPKWFQSHFWGWLTAILSIAMPVISIVYYLRGGDALIAWLLVAPIVFCWPDSISRILEGTKQRSGEASAPTGVPKS